MTSTQVKINDVTLREGDQAPLTSFNKEEKKIIALMLQEFGIDTIEAGFAASRVDFDNIKGVCQILDSDGPVVATLGRATKSDTEASLEVVKGHTKARIHIFLATSDEHLEAKFGNKAPTLEAKRAWLIDQIQNEVGRAKKYKDTHNDSLEIEFSPEDATGNALTKRQDGKKYLDFQSEQFDFLVTVCEKAIQSGATIINAPDTLGNFLPHETERFFQELTQRLSPLKEQGYYFDLSAHIHNDLGMASANAISAIRGGATQLELTIHGIGERTGNTPLHEIIGLIGEKGHAILDQGEVCIHPKIQTQLVGPISDFVSRILGLNKLLQAPFIGALSDVDGSGVHNAAPDVYGKIKNKSLYGGGRMPVIFSPRGGANQVRQILSGYGINEQKDSKIIESVTFEACERSELMKALYESSIYSLYMKHTQQFQIKDIRIDGNQVEIILMIHGKEICISGKGEGENGVIDGVISGINTYLGEKVIDIDDMKIINKPSLSEMFHKFEKDVSFTSVKLSETFSNKVKEIIPQERNGRDTSKQIGVAHVALKIDGAEVWGVSNAYNVNRAVVEAIIEGSLRKILDKTTSE